MRNMEERMICYLNFPNHRMHLAANCLQMILSGEAHDIYAADILYHKSCYTKFAPKPLESEEHVYSDDTVIANSLLDEFFLKLERSILYQKSAFVLSDLLKDLTRMFDEQSIPHISTKELKR